MTEYIEREAAFDLVTDFAGQASTKSAYSAFRKSANAIKGIPAADVVEVVRCKDCAYWQDNNGGYPHEECRWGKGETPDADDYCSYGERKGEGE